MQSKRNPSKLSGSERSVEILENGPDIVPDINDHVAAVYDKIYASKVVDIDDSDAEISFYEHAGTLSTGFTFLEP